MKRMLATVLRTVSIISFVLTFVFPNFTSLAAQIPKQPKAQQPPSNHIVPPSPRATRVNQLGIAQRQILVKLGRDVDRANFLLHAQGKGLKKLGRIYKSDWLIMGIPSSRKPAEAISVAKGLPGVLNATPDPIVRLQAMPHDPIFKDDDDPSTKPCDPLEEICDPYDLVDQWGLFKVGALAAWDIQTGNSSVTIAVVDSGIDLDHDDLYNNIWTNPGEFAGNGVDDDGNGIVDDAHGADFVGLGVGDPDADPVPPSLDSVDGNPDIPEGGLWNEDYSTACYIPYGYGLRFEGDPAVGDACDNNLDTVIDAGVTHGTMVAGVAAAMSDNVNPGTGLYEGMAGACWNCKLMGVRVINAEGWGLGSAGASAINYAADMGADIINISWGFDPSGPDPDGEVAAITDAVNYAAAQGAILVAAAGNGEGPPVLFPASLPNTIAVGSSDWLDQVSVFSSTMTATQLSSQVLDVVAPGDLIWSTCVYGAIDELVYNLFLGDFSVTAGLDTYCVANGTSFSAPLVSGYIGLLLSQDPSLALPDIRTILHDNAVDIADPGYDSWSGHGRLQMVIPGSSPPPSNTPPTASFTYLADGLSVVFTNTSGDADGSISTSEWDFGDESLHSADPSPSHVYSAAGTYTVTLTVTDNAAATDSVAQEVKVSDNTPPVAAFRYSCDGTLCDFTSLSTDDVGVTRYVWDFGDGESSNGRNPSHRYAKRGNYIVNLTVFDEKDLNDTVAATVKVKNRGLSEGSAGGSEPPPPGSGGDTNAMYIWDISMAEKGKSMAVSVTVLRDFDGDGVVEKTDAPVDGAYVEGWLCPVPSGACSFVGSQSFTDARGKAKWKLVGATASAYSFEVKSIDRSPYTWSPSLDNVPNPSYYP
jgi:subtilisin family serine protease